jgi:hypothetical protein
MRQLKGIAALLIFVLMMPLAHACVMASHVAKAQHDCCQHKDVVVQCGEMPSDACCSMQAPVDATPYPVQSISQLVLPPTTVAVAYNDQSVRLESRGSAMHLPEQHSPPGLVIAATIVLRI